MLQLEFLPIIVEYICASSHLCALSFIFLPHTPRRVILKMAFVREGALISDEMKVHVSHHQGSSSNVGKRKKKNRVDASDKRQGSTVEVGKKKKRRRR